MEGGGSVGEGLASSTFLKQEIKCSFFKNNFGFSFLVTSSHPQDADIAR